MGKFLYDVRLRESGILTAILQKRYGNLNQASLRCTSLWIRASAK